MNFLCPACRTPIPRAEATPVVPCTACGLEVDVSRLDTSPGFAPLRADVDLTGEQLGGFHLLRRLGAGGMGIVYEATGPAGPCAVKVLGALLAADPALRTRFRREAAALRAIDHPGVVRVLADGEERGFCWYAMELVAGPDLRTRLAAGPLPAPEVERLARALLAALAEVHARGFVHRDVKPGNILLAGAEPKLCDFGIARFDGATTLTESAAVLGSLRYMAPEQRLGRVTPQSDLYALGLALHEALAGGVPDEKALPRGVPRRLRKLLARLTASRAVDRAASADEALELLDRRSGRTAALAVAATVVLLAILGGLLARREPDPPPVPVVVTPPPAAVVGAAEPKPALPEQRLSNAPVNAKAPPPMDEKKERVATERVKLDLGKRSSSKKGRLDAIRGTALTTPPATFGTGSAPTKPGAPAKD